MKHFNRVLLVDAMFFTKHGLHMNTRGKENMAKKLADVKREMVNKHGKKGVNIKDVDR